MKKIRMIIAVTLFATTLCITGCSTISGMGKDIARMSDWTQDKLDNGFEQKGNRQ